MRWEQRRAETALRMLSKRTSWSDIGDELRFGFATYNEIPSPAIVIENLQKELGAFGEPQRARRELRAREKTRKERARKHRTLISALPRVDRRLATYLQEIIRIRDVLRDVIGKAHVVTFEYGISVLAAAGLAESLVYFCSLDEILRGRDFLEQHGQDLLHRRDGCLGFIDYSGNVAIEYGSYPKAERRLASFYKGRSGVKLNSSNRIVGQTGCRGTAEGRSRIVQNLRKDGKKFREGEVLVTGMTRPEYVPLMKMAAAIITDEGGVTCHAAIVARELDKPCVIGTRVATSTITTGQRVKVNGNKGEVLILDQQA